MTDSSHHKQGIVWEPSPDWIQHSHLHRFMKLYDIPDYPAFHLRSVENVPWFTDAIMSYLEIQFSTPYSRVMDTAEDIPDPVRGNEIAASCVLLPTSPADENTRQELTDRVRVQMGKPFSPRAIYFLSDLPRTRNAKIMRRITRSSFWGEDPGDTSALENPECWRKLPRFERLDPQDRSLFS